MRFGERLRQLRNRNELSQRELAVQVGVNFTYISKIENEKLDFAQFPGESLIRKLAEMLKADEEELLILAERVPDRIKKRVIERPDAFGRFADLDDEALDRILMERDGSEG